MRHDVSDEDNWVGRSTHAAQFNGGCPSYLFELALQVGEVAVESAVLRLQFGELGVLQAQSLLSSPQLGQRVGQIALLLLVPERDASTTLSVM